MRFVYKHCNFSHALLLVKMASKTVTRSIRSTIELFSGEERRLCVIIVTLWQLTLLENEIFYPSKYLTGNKFSLAFCKFPLHSFNPANRTCHSLPNVVTWCDVLHFIVSVPEFIWNMSISFVRHSMLFFCFNLSLIWFKFYFLLFQNHYHTLPYITMPKYKRKWI